VSRSGGGGGSGSGGGGVVVVSRGRASEGGPRGHERDRR